MPRFTGKPGFFLRKTATLRGRSSQPKTVNFGEKFHLQSDLPQLDQLAARRIKNEFPN
jgi:hypothetical protein